MMKVLDHFLFVLFITFIIVSCNSDDLDTSDIIGKWKLTQVLADPGDGSGTFMDVESNKTITFSSNRTFISENGVVCFMSDAEETSSTGTFSSEAEEIYPNSCETFAEVRLSYTIDKGNLIINYPCIEPCVEKYIKIE